MIKHPISTIINYLFDCYQSDDTTYINNDYDSNNYTYTFNEWYFLYRKKRVYKFNNKMKYKLTPRTLDIPILLF